MEHEAAWNLQNSLKDLTLESTEQEARQLANRVLLGKVLSTRPFRRFTITSIISKVWQMVYPVKIEKCGDNIFRFEFVKREDKEKIYRRRPWNLDGAHLVLKEWDPEVQVQKTCFDMSAFYVQVHGLPLTLMNPTNALRIGEKLGKVLLDSLDKCVVGGRYLRFRVEIRVEQPLPAGYFLNRGNGEDIWIQFKLERLSDFCYKCGRLSHVTRRCNFGTPATITTSTGVVAKLYGPWIRAEEQGSLLFVNPPEDESRRKKFQQDLQLISNAGGMNSNVFPIGESNLKQFGKGGEDASSIGDKVLEDNADCYNTALQMCPQLHSLHITLKRTSLMDVKDLQQAVVQHIRSQQMTTGQLGEWAEGLIQAIASLIAQNNIQLSVIGPVFRDWLGTRPGCIEEPSNTKVDEKEHRPIQIAKKRPSQFDYPPGTRRTTEEVGPDQEFCGPVVESVDTPQPILTDPHLEEAPLQATPSEVSLQIGVSENPLSFHPGSSAERSPETSRRRRPWKRDARNRLSRSSLTPPTTAATSSRQRGHLQIDEVRTVEDFRGAEEAGRSMPLPFP